MTIKDMQTKDLLVAVDIETTGLDPHIHDMWEIAVIPFKFIEDGYWYELLPCTFKSKIRPQNPVTMQPKALEVGGVTKEELMSLPMNLYQVLNSFYEWKLEMYPEYRFVPVGHNYASFDKQFLISKMNYFNYDQNFSHHCLDTKIIAKYYQSIGFDLGKRLSLQGLKIHFNLDSNKQLLAHTSAGDAELSIQLLCSLNSLTRG